MNNKPLILVADDDLEFLSYLELLLQSKGFAVDVARNGLEAWDKLRTHKYGLLITDIHMPHFNGFEIVEHLRKNDVRLPIVMISSTATDATINKAITMGDITILKKPINSNELIIAVNKGLAKKSELIKKNRRILVVDDDDQFRENVANFLHTSGYEVISARNGQSALNIAKDAKPHFDITLVDENMPDMPGHAVIAELEKTSPDTLPVLISGEATSDEVGKAYGAGAFSYIRKPVSLSTLLACVTSYEEDADKRKKVVERQKMYEGYPFYEKSYLWLKEYIDAPPNSLKNMQFRTFMISILALIFGFILLLVIENVQQYAEESQAKIEKTTELLKEANNYERLRQDEIERRKIGNELYRNNRER